MALSKSKTTTRDPSKLSFKWELMPSTSSEITTTRKSSAEDSSSKWEDNKSKPFKTGPVLVTCPDNSEDQSNPITIKISQDNQEPKDLKIKQLNNTPRKIPLKKNPQLKNKSSLKRKQKSNQRLKLKQKLKSNPKRKEKSSPNSKTNTKKQITENHVKMAKRGLKVMWREKANTKIIRKTILSNNQRKKKHKHQRRKRHKPQRKKLKQNQFIKRNKRRLNQRNNQLKKNQKKMTDGSLFPTRTQREDDLKTTTRLTYLNLNYRETLPFLIKFKKYKRLIFIDFINVSVY